MPTFIKNKRIEFLSQEHAIVSILEVMFQLHMLFSVECLIRDANKALARPDWKKHLKVRHFSSDAVIAAADTWLDGQPSEMILSGLGMFEFGRWSLFPSWSG